MNIPEFRAFINEALDKAEAEHGPIPVVMWDQRGKFMQEYIPLNSAVVKAGSCGHGRYQEISPFDMERDYRTDINILVIGN